MIYTTWVHPVSVLICCERNQDDLSDLHAHGPDTLTLWRSLALQAAKSEKSEK